MYRTRDIVEPDRAQTYSKLPSRVNHFNMYCGGCHGSYFVNKPFYEQIIRSMEDGLDNPFLCDDCQEDVDALEHDRGH